jgi:hypothetical protein
MEAPTVILAGLLALLPLADGESCQNFALVPPI